MDKLAGMQVFVKAVECGSFTAAGEALSMSSQLVGKHVAALEQHLGVHLIQRTTRQHSLTEAGRHFYERCKIILAEVDAAEAFAAEARSTPRGVLRISAPMSFGTHALAPKLPLYLRQHPEVRIDLSLSNRMVDVVDEGYDVVFRIGELPDSGLIAKPLAPYRLIACAAPAYLAAAAPLKTPQDLSQHECLVFARTSLRSQWTFLNPNGQEIAVPIRGRLQIDDNEALLQAALAGYGVLLQPAESVMPYLQSGQLVAVLPDYAPPARALHAVYAPDRRMTPKLRSFLDFAGEHFA